MEEGYFHLASGVWFVFRLEISFVTCESEIVDFVIRLLNQWIHIAACVFEYMCI